MIKYLGSKRQLLPAIMQTIGRHENVASVLDLFSGTSRVGHALKRAGHQVFSNDLNVYAYQLAKCYIGADRDRYFGDAEKIIQELNGIQGSPGYFTKNFCEDALFFHPKNGARVDAIREAIEKKEVDEHLRAILLTSLLEATDRVDATCGMQMSYLKFYPRRALKDLELRVPELLPRSPYGAGSAYCRDAGDLVQDIEVDLAYLDPPYNQHSYRSNYHIWESLCLWDKPEVYGKARKRMDCKTTRSPFNHRKTFEAAFRGIIEGLRAKVIIVSFSNEGFMSREIMEGILREKGSVSVEGIDYRRYVGAQIGVYNPHGKIAGEVSHLYNKEYLYTVKVA